MAGWLLPALKAVLPHMGDILSAAKPAFTKRKPEPAANQAELVQQQIAELQAAVSQQSAHIKELAAQLENTITALDKAAVLAEARLRRVLIFTAVAAAFAVAALGIAFIAVITR
jgi:soluble cytochrome b562